MRFKLGRFPRTFDHFEVHVRPRFSLSLLTAALFLFPAASAQLVTMSQSAPGAQSQAQAPKGTGSIEGTVLTQEGDRPIRKATVTLTPEFSNVSNLAEAMSMMQNVKSATTDGEGHFEIHDLARGSYRMSVQHPTYVGAGKNAKTVNLLVNLADGQQMKDVVFRMIPGAVITGHVVDEDGDPVPKASVQALQKTSVRGKQQWTPLGFVMTDDLGQFRIGSLTNGRYYVVAAPLGDMQVNSSGAQNPRQYVKTYYPSTAAIESASPVDVKGGDEFPLNIQLVKADTYPVKGTVIGANGSKAPAGMVWLSSANDIIPTSGVPTVIKDGTFETRVPPGKYRVMAMMMGDPTNISSMTYAFENIDVTTAGLQNVKVQTAAGAKVTVRVRTEGANPPKVGGMRFSLSKRGDDEIADTFSSVFGGGGRGSVSADGIADLGTVNAGTYDLTWSSRGGAAEDWYLKSVVVGSHDVTREGVRINGSNAIQVEAVLSGASARVEGTIATQAGRSVVVVAVPDQELRKNSAAYHTGSLDPSGKFAIRGLPPGRYTLLALENPDPEEWLDPDFLKQVESKGEPIVLGENERKQQVQLKSISAADVKTDAGQ